MYYFSKDLESCFRITLNNHVKQFIIPLQHDLNRFCTTQLLSSNAFSQNVDKKYSNRRYLPGLAWLRLSIPLITKLCFKSSNDMVRKAVRFFGLQITLVEDFESVVW